MRLTQILTEANFADVHLIDNFLKRRYVSQLKTKEGQSFFAKTVKKQIINLEVNAVSIMRKASSITSSDDFIGTLKNNPWIANVDPEEMIYFYSPTKISSAYDDIFHWVATLEDDLNSEDQHVKLYASRTLSKLFKMKYNDIVSESQAYYRRGSKNIDTKNLKGREFLLQTGDYFWYKLTSQEAYKEEGKFLQNCIGSHYHFHKDNDYSIIVMKDKTGDSHVAIRLKDNQIVELKGKNNKEPIEKYLIPSLEFIKHFKLIIKNIGSFIQYDNEFYTTAQFKAKLLGNKSIVEITNSTIIQLLITQFYVEYKYAILQDNGVIIAVIDRNQEYQSGKDIRNVICKSNNEDIVITNNAIKLLKNYIEKNQKFEFKFSKELTKILYKNHKLMLFDNKLKPISSIMKTNEGMMFFNRDVAKALFSDELQTRQTRIRLSSQKFASDHQNVFVYENNNHLDIISWNKKPFSKDVLNFINKFKTVSMDLHAILYLFHNKTKFPLAENIELEYYPNVIWNKTANSVYSITNNLKSTNITGRIRLYLPVPGITVFDYNLINLFNGKEIQANDFKSQVDFIKETNPNIIRFIGFYTEQRWNYFLIQTQKNEFKCIKFYKENGHTNITDILLEVAIGRGKDNKLSAKYEKKFGFLEKKKLAKINRTGNQVIKPGSNKHHMLLKLFKRPWRTTTDLIGKDVSTVELNMLIKDFGLVVNDDLNKNRPNFKYAGNAWILTPKGKQAVEKLEKGEEVGRPLNCIQYKPMSKLP